MDAQNKNVTKNSNIINKKIPIENEKVKIEAKWYDNFFKFEGNTKHLLIVCGTICVGLLSSVACASLSKNDPES